MEILAFAMENAQDPYSTNEWEEFIGDNEFDEIVASAAHAKSQKGISAEHFSKLWSTDLESSQKTLNVITQRGVRNENYKPP